jgi:hypothetical protein
MSHEPTSKSRFGSDPVVPPIPVRLAALPTVGGLTVPWITLTTSDGRHLFGALDPVKQYTALTRRLCQVCGQPLLRPSVLFMRLGDLPSRRTSEPCCHPECGAYVQTACPMIAGRMSHHRSTPQRLDHTMINSVDTPVRLGKPAQPWFAVWLNDYRVVTDPRTGGPAASYAHTTPLRIRPVGGWLTILGR